MHPADLLNLNADDLAGYLWKRLRREPPMDPPLRGPFEEEEPEAIVLEALRTDPAGKFRETLMKAIQHNLADLVALQADRWRELWRQEVFNEQLASLAYLAAETYSADKADTAGLGDALYMLVSPWVTDAQTDDRWSLGQVQAIRALTWLQHPGPDLARFWRMLWQAAPAHARGIVIFGWSRVDADAALSHLDELLKLREQIDLPNTLLTLVKPPGPGAKRLGEAAKGLAQQNVDVLLGDLEQSGARWQELIEFAKTAKPSEEAVEKHILARLPWRIEKKKDCRHQLRGALVTICKDILRKDAGSRETQQWLIEIADRRQWDQWAVESLPSLVVQLQDDLCLLWKHYVDFIDVASGARLRPMRQLCNSMVALVQANTAQVRATIKVAIQEWETYRLENPWSGNQTMLDMVGHYKAGHLRRDLVNSGR